MNPDDIAGPTSCMHLREKNAGERSSLRDSTKLGVDESSWSTLYTFPRAPSSPPQKVLGTSKPTPDTSEGTWSPRDLY